MGQNKPKTVLITNCHCYHHRGFEENRGSEAVMIGTIESLKKYLPDINIVTFCQFSDKFTRLHDITVVPQKKIFRYKAFSPTTSLFSWLNLGRCFLWHSLRKILHLDCRFLITKGKLRYYSSADIIIDLSMDLYSDDFGLISVIEHTKDILCSVWLDKPVVLYAQSIGPFKNKLTSFLARFAMKRVTLITVRENITYEYLKKFKLNGTSIVQTADPAFLVSPAPAIVVEKTFALHDINPNNGPIIGITVTSHSPLKQLKNNIFWNIFNSAYQTLQYLIPETFFISAFKRISSTQLLEKARKSCYKNIDEILKVVKSLANRYQATILIIPHDIDNSLVFGDIDMAYSIYNRIKDEIRIHLILNDYSTTEIKAIIGKCDLFFGMRMHPSIGALSQYVPTIVLSYSHKFNGIMSMIGQEEYILGALSAIEIIQKFDEAWNDRIDIKNRIKSFLPDIKKSALLNAEISLKLLNV